MTWSYRIGAIAEVCNQWRRKSLRGLCIVNIVKLLLPFLFVDQRRSLKPFCENPAMEKLW